MAEAVEKIEAVSSAKKKISAVSAPDKAEFDALMQQKVAPAVAETPEDQATKPSFMDQVAKAYTDKYLGNNSLTADAIQKTKESAQKVEAVAKTLEDFKTEYPTAQFPTQYREGLSKKLTHIEENIKIASSQVGVEYTPPGEGTTALKTPIDKFLGSLASAQYQLNNMGNVLADMSAQGNDISPSRMLAIQLKANQISQQLELFTNLLNKALEAIKTTMNVQV